MTEKIKLNKKRYDEIKRALRSGGLLEVPDELKKPGFHQRYFSDENPNRLAQAKAMGYVPCCFKEGDAYTIYGGVSARGTEYRLHLMEISEENKKELDFVRNSEKESKREDNMNSAFTGLQQEEVYTKKGMGDLKSLSNVKQL